MLAVDLKELFIYSFVPMIEDPTDYRAISDFQYNIYSKCRSIYNQKSYKDKHSMIWD